MKFSSATLLVIMALATVFTHATAQKKTVKNWYHAQLFMKDGTIVENYLKNEYVIAMPHGTTYYHEPSAIDDVIKLSSMESGSKSSDKYNTADIDSMYTWYDEMPDKVTVWETQPINYSYGFDEPVGETYPVMMKRTYNGKHVKGYVTYHPAYGFRLLYKMPDMPSAKAFGKVQNKLTGARKKSLLEEFSSYPEMQKYLQNLDKKVYTKTPFEILKHLDNILEK